MGFIEERIKYAPLKGRVISAQEAAAKICDGMTVAIPEFGSYSNPLAICDAITARVRDKGEKLELGLIKCANAHPRIEKDWAEYGIMKRRMIFFVDGTVRQLVNTDGAIEFQDPHLSQVPDKMRHGVFGKIDYALVSCAGINEDGELLPLYDQGYTQAALDCAENVLLEISTESNPELYKLHDVYGRTTIDKKRDPIPITGVMDRIGSHFYHVDSSKISGIVISDTPMTVRPMWNVADNSNPRVGKIAGLFIDFIEREVEEGRLSNPLPPIQTGAGAIADAALLKIGEKFSDIKLYTEGIMGGAFELLKQGKITEISSGGLSVDASFDALLKKDIDSVSKKIVIRSSEVANSVEVINRLGVIAMNNALEADLYGNINSTNAFGTRMISGIGGSGDYARNAYLTVFFTMSTAKNGAISSIVPMCSHIDHTEHDVDVIITEYGVADLRNKSPRQRAAEMIRITHPDYRGMLQDYYDRAVAACGAGNCHTPHMLEEAFSWHIRYQKTGSMKLN